MKRLMFFVALLLVGAGAVAAQTAKSAAAPRKKLCTVSAIGGSLTLKKIGFMVFGNEQTTVPIPDWKIDDRVNALVARVLRKNFKVKRIPLPRGGFRALTQGREDYRVEIGSALRKVAGKVNCDFILVIESGGSQYASTNQFVSGLGVLYAPNIINSGRYVHAIPVLLVYDGKNFELLREERHSSLETMFEPIHGPHRILEGKFSENLRDMLKDPRVRSIIWTLLESDLTKRVPRVLAAN